MSKMKLDVVGLDHRVLRPQQRMLEMMLRDHFLKAKLQREPNNLHDRNAIRVIIIDKRPRQRWPKEFRNDNFHIGYIRATTAKVLAPGFDRKSLVVRKCHLIEVNSRHGWGRVQVIFENT